MTNDQGPVTRRRTEWGEEETFSSEAAAQEAFPVSLEREIDFAFDGDGSAELTGDQLEVLMNRRTRRAFQSRAGKKVFRQTMAEHSARLDPKRPFAHLAQVRTSLRSYAGKRLPECSAREVETFLRVLAFRKGDVVVVNGIRPNKGGAPGFPLLITGDLAADAARLARRAQDQFVGAGYHVYLSRQPLPTAYTGTRASDADVHTCTGLFFDFDGIRRTNGPAPFARVAHAIEAAYLTKAYLEERFGPCCAALVFTGHGVQLHVVVRRLEYADGAAWPSREAWAKNTNRRIKQLEGEVRRHLKKCGMHVYSKQELKELDFNVPADVPAVELDSMAEASRLCRLPGTINFRDATDPRGTFHIESRRFEELNEDLAVWLEAPSEELAVLPPPVPVPSAPHRPARQARQARTEGETDRSSRSPEAARQAYETRRRVSFSDRVEVARQVAVRPLLEAHGFVIERDRIMHWGKGRDAVGVYDDAAVNFGTERSALGVTFPGMGMSVDAIGFVMQTQNCDFKAAVDYLVPEDPVTMPARLLTPAELARAQEGAVSLDALQVLLQQWVAEARVDLRQAPAARWIETQGLDTETLKRFHIVYETGRFFRELEGSLLERARDAGLIYDTEKRGAFFARRISYPIIDAEGAWRSAGGRWLTDTDEKSKTIRLPARGVGRWPHCLGAHLVTDATKTFVVLEGDRTCFRADQALRQAGRTEVAVLATLGRPSEAQCEAIAHLAIAGSRRVVMAFDNDALGHEATESLGATLRQRDVSVDHVVFAEGEDPGDVLERDGADAFVALVDAATAWAPAGDAEGASADDDLDILHLELEELEDYVEKIPDGLALTETQRRLRPVFECLARSKGAAVVAKGIKQRLKKRFGTSIDELNEQLKATRARLRAEAEAQLDGEPERVMDTWKGADAQDHVVPKGYGISNAAAFPNTASVFRIVASEDGISKPPVFAYPVLISEGGMVDTTTERQSVLTLQWQTNEGAWMSAELPAAEVMDAKKIVSALRNAGCPISSEQARDMVAYLQAYETANAAHIRKVKLVTQLGFYGEQFLLGDQVIAAPNTEPAETLRFYGRSSGEAQLVQALTSKGTLQGWQEAIAQVKDLPLVMAGVVMSFASVALQFIKAAPFFCDWCAPTGTGKTELMRVASSVWADPGRVGGDKPPFMVQWSSTNIGAERWAGTRRHLPVFLDDTANARDEKQIRKAMYQLANGVGDVRGSVKGTQAVHTFCLLILSTGEHSIVRYSPGAGGAAMRLLSFPGLPWGEQSIAAVERQHRVLGALEHHHGVAGPAWIRHLLSVDRRQLETGFRGVYRATRAWLFSEHTGDASIASRIGEHVAGGIWTADELHRAGILPWPDAFDAKALIHGIMREANESVDVAAKALHHIMDFAQQKSRHFHGWPAWRVDADGHRRRVRVRVSDAADVYGVFREGAYIGIKRVVAKPELERAGFPPIDSLIDEWIRRGWVERGRNERRVCDVKFQGERILVIKFNWPFVERFFGAEADDPEDTEHPEGTAGAAASAASGYTPEPDDD